MFSKWAQNSAFLCSIFKAAATSMTINVLPLQLTMINIQF